MNWIALTLLINVTDASLTPAIWHADRFPHDRATIGLLLEFNRDCRRHVCKLQMIHPDSDLLCTIGREFDDLHQVWDLLRDAKIETWTVWARREALLKLLNKIGLENFLAGRMPPHVPFWRFACIRQ